MFIAKLNKPVGKTPFQLITKLSKKTGKRYFHTGTLDILATGLIIAIDTRLRFLEKPFKKLSKTYEFEVIEGFCTDTHDLLGLVTQTSKLQSTSLQIPKEYKMQVPPKVSYKNLNSKAKLNNFLSGKPLKELPAKKVKIYNLKLLDSYTITKDQLYKKIDRGFKKIEADFRQEKILKKYNQVYTKIPDKLTVFKYQVNVSGGFYIRAFVRDITTLNKLPLTTFSIKRTKVGFFKL